jgi:hypothetical protein
MPNSAYLHPAALDSKVHRAGSKARAWSLQDRCSWVLCERTVVCSPGALEPPEAIAQAALLFLWWSGRRFRRVNRKLAPTRMHLGQGEQVLYGLHLLPLRRRGMNPEPPLQFRDQPKAVGLAVHLQIPAETDRSTEVRAWPECDLFQESVNSGG